MNYVNKVIYGNTTLLDLTSDTATADKVLSGYTFHDKSGASVTGTAEASVALIETVLWTNPSPSSGMGTQQITLSDNISNYDFIKVEFCDSNTTTTILSNVIYSVEDLKKFTSATSFRGGLSMWGSGSNSLYNREFGYINETTLAFVPTMKTYISSSTRQYISSVAIPTKIIGLKKTSAYEEATKVYFSMASGASPRKLCNVSDVDYMMLNFDDGTYYQTWLYDNGTLTRINGTATYSHVYISNDAIYASNLSERTTTYKGIIYKGTMKVLS